MGIRVHVNCAMSLDGCIGLAGPRPVKLSSPEDFRRVHELRASVDAILVGVGTVVADDPKLTVKWDLLGRPPSREPVRVILDPTIRTPPESHALRHGPPTLLIHGIREGRGPPGALLEYVPRQADGRFGNADVLAALERRRIRTVLVEGGSQVITSFLKERLVDELTIFVAPRLIGDPGAPRLFSEGSAVQDLDMVFAGASVHGNGPVLRWLKP